MEIFAFIVVMGISMGNKPASAILRPLNNITQEKESIVKWSQNLIFIAM